jgi:hypothetical protein
MMRILAIGALLWAGAVQGRYLCQNRHQPGRSLCLGLGRTRNPFHRFEHYVFRRRSA